MVSNCTCRRAAPSARPSATSTASRCGGVGRSGVGGVARHAAHQAVAAADAGGTQPLRTRGGGQALHTAEGSCLRHALAARGLLTLTHVVNTYIASLLPPAGAPSCTCVFDCHAHVHTAHRPQSRRAGHRQSCACKAPSQLPCPPMAYSPAWPHLATCRATTVRLPVLVTRRWPGASTGH